MNGFWGSLWQALLMDSARAAGRTILQKLQDPRIRVLIAQNFAMDWSMLWKDLFGGFLIAGAMAAFIPNGFWSALFLHGAPAYLQVPANAVIGPLIAIISFVCSIGNVPLAAILWGSGISFGGVLSFLYADLIVLPLLDVYRRYYGWKMAAYIGVIFFVTMALSGILMDILFSAFHLVPAPNPHIREQIVAFSFNYTFYLNLAFALFAGYLVYLNWKNPMDMDMHHAGGGHDAHSAAPFCWPAVTDTLKTHFVAKLSLILAAYVPPPLSCATIVGPSIDIVGMSDATFTLAPLTGFPRSASACIEVSADAAATLTAARNRVATRTAIAFFTGYLSFGLNEHHSVVSPAAWWTAATASS